MTARPLTDAEARRVTTCDCGHPWASHERLKGERYCFRAGCPCRRGNETLTQVAALVAEREAAHEMVAHNGLGKVVCRCGATFTASRLPATNPPDAWDLYGEHLRQVLEATP